jgi:hypothetical protein
VVGALLKLVNIIEVDMPYVNKPRPYKKEYKQQVARGEADERLARARARYSIDKKGADKNGNGKADAREGKDVAHKVALSKGGTNEQGLRIESPAKNRSFKRNSGHKLVSETSKRERGKI